MEASVEKALQEARRRLEEMYGERLVRVILYGSHARADAKPDSDVDIMVVLDGDFVLYPGVKRLSELKLDLLFKYDVYLSIQPYSKDDFEDRQRPFMQNVHREGITL